MNDPVEELPDALLKAFATARLRIIEAHERWIESLARTYPVHIDIVNLLLKYHGRISTEWTRQLATLLLIARDENLLLEWLVDDAYECRVQARTKFKGNTSPENQRTREALIEATIQIIVRGKELTMTAIAQEAGLALPTARMYFTREELRKIAFDRLLERLYTALTSRL